MKYDGLQITSDQESKIIKNIEDELSRIEKEYGEIEYFEKVRKSQEEYEGIKENINFPIQNASNRKILLLTVVCDIIASKGKKQTTSPSPVILIEKNEAKNYEIGKREALGVRREKERYNREREDKLHDIMMNQVKLDDLSAISYRMSGLQGVSIIKVTYCNDTEKLYKKRKYTKDEKNRYENDFGDKLVDTSSQEYKDWEKLNNGEDVEAEYEDEVVHFKGVKAYRVPLENFYARPTIKEFWKHKVLGERMPEITWNDIESNSIGGYYDDKKVEILKEKSGKDYYSENYVLWECIVKEDLDDTGEYRRFQVTFDSKTRTILRIKPYTELFEHGKICYVPACILPKDTSWIGYDMYSRTQDVIDIAEVFLNSALNEYALAHQPIVFTDSQRDLTRVNVENVTVVKIEKGTTVTPVRLDYASMDRVQFINWVQGMGELISGVQSSLMSGKETAFDPRAPLGKSALKLQESNLRVEDLISNLQKADEQIAEQAEKLYYQYEEPEKDIDFNVKYICHGSRISFDKMKDLQMAMSTIDFIIKYFPEIWQNLEVRAKMLEIILNNSDGSVERNKDTLMRPMRLLLEAKAEQAEKIRQQQEQGATQNLPAELPPQLAQIINQTGNGGQNV